MTRTTESYLSKLKRRILCATDSTSDPAENRHCYAPDEFDVNSDNKPNTDRDFNLDAGVLPTPPPTPAPTLTPTPEPTTLMPTFEPTFEQTVNCASDEDGNYGVISGANSIMVPYVYQVDTTAQLTQSTLNDDVLPELEEGVSNAVIPTLFFGDDNTCSETAGASATARGGGGRQRKGRQLKLSSSIFQRLLQDDELIGLSADPADTVLEGAGGVQCPLPLDGAAERCYVVGGGITFYGNPGADLSWVEAESNALIQESMDSGSLNDINDEVVSVRYIGTENLPTAVDRDIVEPRKLPPVWGWVLIGVGSGLLLCMVAYCVTGKKNNSSGQRQGGQGQVDVYRDEH